MAFGDDVVLVDRLEVLLARGDETAAVEVAEPLDRAGDHLAHAVLDEARAGVRLFDDRDLVAPLHQLVDLRRHAGLGDLQQQLRVDLLGDRLRETDLEGREPALVVRRHGNVGEDLLDLAGVEAIGLQALARPRGDQFLGAGAGRHPGCRDANGSPRPARIGDSAADQRVDLLRLDPRDRGRLVLRVARVDHDLGPRRALALTHQLGDVPRQRLRAERSLSKHHLADRLVDDLLEARHVRALLVAVQVDEAVKARVEQLLADPDDLLDARHSDARKRQRNSGRTRLDVIARAQRMTVDEERPAGLHGDSVSPC